MRQFATVKEGVITGAIGATAVAIWFLIVDLVSGQPFHTPATLGEAVSAIFGPTEGESAFRHVALYTLFHYAVFALVGIVAAWVLRGSHREPTVLIALFILFVAFEVGFYALTYLLSLSPSFGNLAWYQVGAANLVAAALMGGYLLKRHPHAAQDLADTLAARV
ncbi:MAG TPA: hypothetical protein VJ717_00855 [Gemmatimonadaceae bacterium]|nr:hypothetical protein [Gemmatimonadaceae bacterium]